LKQEELKREKNQIKVLANLLIASIVGFLSQQKSKYFQDHKNQQKPLKLGRTAQDVVLGTKNKIGSSVLTAELKSNQTGKGDVNRTPGNSGVFCEI
jgi:hypothetical protein